MYRYIGNKTKLLPYITDKIQKIVPNGATICDLMAGTGVVSYALSDIGYRMISSDIMTYSKCHLTANLLIHRSPTYNKTEIDGYEKVIDFLNSIEPLEGYFYKEFSPDGEPVNGCEPRKYFSSDNAKKIDAIRNQINIWTNNRQINEQEEMLLKNNIIMAVNDVANISGTYGYFLSDLKKNARNPIKLEPTIFDNKHVMDHRVIQGFAEEIASNITADLCYIDPPYMKRQYAANYHILETIARGDFPEAVGKSGLRNWWDQHSKLCTKTKGLDSLRTIIENMKCDNFIISYSEDGLFTLEQLTNLFKDYGTVEVQFIDYNRFKSNGSMLPKKLKEYIICLRRR